MLPLFLLLFYFVCSISRCIQVSLLIRRHTFFFVSFILRSYTVAFLSFSRKANRPKTYMHVQFFLLFSCLFVNTSRSVLCCTLAVIVFSPQRSHPFFIVGLCMVKKNPNFSERVPRLMCFASSLQLHLSLCMANSEKIATFSSDL